MFTLTAKVRSNSSGADLRRGDEVFWNGLWHEIIDEPIACETYSNGAPAVMAVPVVTVKGREQNTLQIDATAWVMVRRSAV